MSCCVVVWGGEEEGGLWPIPRGSDAHACSGASRELLRRPERGTSPSPPAGGPDGGARSRWGGRGLLAVIIHRGQVVRTYRGASSYHPFWTRVDWPWPTPCACRVHATGRHRAPPAAGFCCAARTTNNLNNFLTGGAEAALCFHESNDGSASETPTLW